MKDEIASKLEAISDMEKVMEEEGARQQLRFEKQKATILQQKSKLQKQELMKSLTKEQRDEMIKNHMRDLKILEDTLQKERVRQTEQLKDKLETRLRSKEMARREKEVKLSQLLKEQQKYEKEKEGVEEQVEQEISVDQ